MNKSVSVRKSHGSGLHSMVIIIYLSYVINEKKIEENSDSKVALKIKYTGTHATFEVCLNVENQMLG